jgi:hypothetical protein
MELGRISALVEFLFWWKICRNYSEILFIICVGGISAEFLQWWNFFRIFTSLCRNSTNAEILQNYTKKIKIKKNLLKVVSID